MGAPQKISKDMVIEAGENEACILSANHVSRREPVEVQADFRYDVEE